MNIFKYLHSKREKFSYTSGASSTRYLKQMHNLMRFNKMEEYKYHFKCEILIIEALKSKSERKIKRNIKKLNRIIDHQEINEGYKNYLCALSAFLLKDYANIFELFDKAFKSAILYDSFLQDINYAILLTEEATNIKYTRDEVTHTWNGVHMIFNCKEELDLFLNNKKVEGTSFNRKLNLLVLNVKSVYEKSLKKFNPLFRNVYINLLESTFDFDKVNYNTFILAKFLSDNFYNEDEFESFKMKISDTFDFLRLIQRFSAGEFELKKEIQTFNISILIPEIMQELEFMQNNLDSLINISKKLIIAHLDGLFDKKRFENMEDEPMVPLPTFYDLAYGFLEDEDIEEELENLKIN